MDKFIESKISKKFYRKSKSLKTFIENKNL